MIDFSQRDRGQALKSSTGSECFHGTTEIGPQLLNRMQCLPSCPANSMIMHRAQLLPCPTQQQTQEKCFVTVSAPLRLLRKIMLTVR